MTPRERILGSLSRSRRAAVVLDFDGTISAIVEQPDDARPVPGAVDALNALVDRGLAVAVLSGRPVSFLQKVLVGLSREAQLIGHSGLEWTVGEHVVVEPEAELWLPQVRDALAQATSRAPRGVLIEDKRLSFAIHYRGADELEEEVRSLAAHVGTNGLSIEPGKMHVEIRPPLAINKGSALAVATAGGVDWLLYAGDDVVDLPAFATVRRSSASSAFCVAVGTDEAPTELVSSADLVVSSPAGMTELLAAMAQALSTKSA